MRIIQLILILTVVCGSSFAQLAIPTNSGLIQKSNDLKDSKINFEDFVKVTLITNSDEYELKKGEKIPVIVRVSNTSNEKLKLYHRPVFNIIRVCVEKYKTRIGDVYTGRIVMQNSLNTENLYLEKGEYLDFEADITELELMHSMSSIDSWKNIFQVLEKGKYNFQAEVAIDFSKDGNPFSKDGKAALKDYLSNTITISNK
jgi:hypothetical protein